MVIIGYYMIITENNFVKKRVSKTLFEQILVRLLWASRLLNPASEKWLIKMQTHPEEDSSTPLKCLLEKAQCCQENSLFVPAQTWNRQIGCWTLPQSRYFRKVANINVFSAPLRHEFSTTLIYLFKDLRAVSLKCKHSRRKGHCLFPASWASFLTDTTASWRSLFLFWKWSCTVVSASLQPRGL